MNDAARKQYMMLAGRPILGHTLAAFDSCRLIDEILIVVPNDDMDFCRTEILASLNLQKKIQLVSGGKKRQDSVYNGLLAIHNKADYTDKNDIVVIHDGVRPFVRSGQIEACINAAKETDGAILGISAFDTLKNVNNEDVIEETLDRKTVWLAQTPQAFKYALIRKAHEDAKSNGFTGTDDASLVERIGGNVKIINGSRHNIKITTRDDLLLAEAILMVS